MNIILTGATGGIGYEIVEKLLAHNNCKIYALVRNEAKAKELFGRNDTALIKKKLDIVSCNLNSTDDINKFSGTIEDGSIDILINNAGLLLNKSVHEYTSKDALDIFQVNLLGPFLLIQSLIPKFRQSSHIVNIGSMGGVQGSVKFKGLSLYSASKGALAILTECLAEELKEKRISVNCLALGAADTEMLRTAFPGYQAPVSAEQMASYIIQFALTGHQYYNGKVLQVSLSTP
jgi:NAD(P)-dependent dehydrogenase (short-subunit alcohol dehydrogenase family)